MTPPQDRLGYLMATAARKWRARLDERLAPLGLTQARWVVLLRLAKAGTHLSQRDLAERVGVEGPTLVRVLDGLERMGLIARHTCSEDRRAKWISLTDTARPVIGDIEKIAANLRNEVLDGLSPADIAGFVAILERLEMNLDSVSHHE